MSILGRNEKCFCGSGKKFKNCCLPLIEKREKFINKTGIQMALLYPEEFDEYLESFSLLCDYRDKVIEQDIEAIYYFMELAYYHTFFKETTPSYETLFSIYCIYFGEEPKTLFDQFFESNDYLSLPDEKKLPFIYLNFIYPGFFKIEKNNGNYNFIDIIRPEIKYKNVFIKYDEYLIEQINNYEFIFSCLAIGEKHSYLINEPFVFNFKKEEDYKKLVESITNDYKDFLKEEKLKDNIKNYIEYCWSSLVGRISYFLKIDDVDSLLDSKIAYAKIYFEVLDFNNLISNLDKNKKLKKNKNEFLNMYEYLKNDSLQFAIYLTDAEMSINFLFKKTFFLFLDEIYYPNKNYLKYIKFEYKST